MTQSQKKPLACRRSCRRPVVGRPYPTTSSALQSIAGASPPRKAHETRGATVRDDAESRGTPPTDHGMSTVDGSAAIGGIGDH